MNSKSDAFTAAVHAFFAARLGEPAALAAQGISLNFDPFPVSIPASAFTEPAQGDRYSAPRAAEHFSCFVADRAASVVDGGRYQSLESISEILRDNVIARAEFYHRIDRTEAQNARARETFELRRTTATQRMVSVASLSGLPREYVPSESAPANWLDPVVPGLWSTFTQTLVDEGAVPTGPTGATGGIRLPWRKISLEDYEDIRLALPPPDDPRPPRPFDFAELKNRPAWMTPAPRAWFKLDRTRLPEARKLGGSELDALASPGPAAGLTPVMDPPAGHPPAAGGTPFLFPPKPKPKRKLDDLFDLDDTATWDDGMLIKTAVLSKSAKPAPGTKKDSVGISFEYQVVQIVRPWLSWSFFTQSDWYIPDARRGEISDGTPDQAAGMLHLIPERVIAIRNLVISAAFTEEDSAAIAASFALGPFRLNKAASIVAGGLRIPGVQIIAYVDRTLPALPPRSDPSFVV